MKRANSIDLKCVSSSAKECKINVNEFLPKTEEVKDYFDDYEYISHQTKRALKLGGFTTAKPVQKQAIPYILNNHDVSVSSKTGSGKTLAFVISIVEILKNNKWSKIQGVGALVLCPTRELASQVASVAYDIAKHSQLSVGLVIGGKGFEMRFFGKKCNKSSTIQIMPNILISTPGRLIDNMGKIENFTFDELKLLILDENDKMLDMGFGPQIDAILEDLPEEKQILLFSATQTKSKKILSKLNMKKDAIFISINDSDSKTPTALKQKYIVVNLDRKLDLLWSFLKKNCSKKILIFLSTCKQTRFIEKCIKKIQPRMNVFSLHGKMSQYKRNATYNVFCKKSNAFLFATDIAARGLDFPAVDWILQFDMPLNSDTYIHRVGRSARNCLEGNSLMFLTEREFSDCDILKKLSDSSVPIKELSISFDNLPSLKPTMDSIIAMDPELADNAKSAIKAYVKFQKFSLKLKLYNEEIVCLSSSFGLAGVPRVVCK